jgi:ATP-dependent helicase YprA (DUF1998 family)
LLPASFVKGSLTYQKKIAKSEFKKNFQQTAKDVQADTIVSVINGFNTMLLAGTGFGKSRIALAYLLLFPLETLPVMIFINPLYALGDNQVSVVLEFPSI